MLFGVLAGGGRRQQHVLVVEIRDHCAGGLLGQPAGLETDGTGAEAPVVDNGGRLEHAFVNFSYRHRSPYSLSGFIQLFRVVTPNPEGSRTTCRFESLDAATAVDRSGRPAPIRGARQPLPKTARYRLVFLRRPVVPRWNGARGSRPPYLVRADGPRTTLTLHADLAIPTTPDDDAGSRVTRDK